MEMPPRQRIRRRGLAAVTCWKKSQGTVLVMLLYHYRRLAGRGVRAPTGANLLVRRNCAEGSNTFARQRAGCPRCFTPVMNWPAVASREIKLGVALWPGFEQRVKRAASGVVKFYPASRRNVMMPCQPLRRLLLPDMVVVSLARWR